MKCERARRHISSIRSRVYELKYQILNDALKGELNNHNIFLFKKYNRRLRWLQI